MLAKMLRASAFPGLIVGALWLGAIIYFQQTGVEPTSAGLLLWFVFVPLAAVGVWVVGKALVRRLSAAPVAATAAPENQVAAQSAARDERLSLRLSILAAEVNTPAGESAEDLFGLIHSGGVRPEICADITDAEGMPVKLARCPNLSEQEYLPWVEQWQRTAGNGESQAAIQGARLLALLHEPLTRTMDLLASIPPLTKVGASQPGHAAPETVPRQLVTKVFAPAPWDEMLSAYIRGQVGSVGKFAFGVVRGDPQRPEQQSDVIRVADAFCKSSQDHYAESILMIVACDSLVSPAQIEELEVRSQLFSSRNLSGRVPAEAAAVLVAVPSALATPEITPLASLHRAAYGERAKPVDAAGRPDASLLKQLASAVLLHADDKSHADSNAASGSGNDSTTDSAPAATVCAIVSDCDHRSDWTTESAMLISDCFEMLDPVADHVAVCSALGNSGHAASALSMAIAAHAAAIEEKNLLLASVADESARSVAMLSPWLPPHESPELTALPDPS